MSALFYFRKSRVAVFFILVLITCGIITAVINRNYESLPSCIKIKTTQSKTALNLYVRSECENKNLFIDSASLQIVGFDVYRKNPLLEIHEGVPLAWKSFPLKLNKIPQSTIFGTAEGAHYELPLPDSILAEMKDVESAEFNVVLAFSVYYLDEHNVMSRLTSFPTLIHGEIIKW